MGRSPCCAKVGIKAGAWTTLEDRVLSAYIKAHGEGNWRNLPTRAGLKRCGKSCRLRWLNYLKPDIKRGNISDEEEDLIIKLHKLLGNRWSMIAKRLPGRTDNEIKNYWNTILSKKVKSKSTLSPSKQGPKNKMKPVLNLQATEECSPQTAAATQTQAIRTKARRCTKVLVPQLFPTPNENDSTKALQLEPHQTHPIQTISDDPNQNWFMDPDQFLEELNASSVFDEMNFNPDLEYLKICLDID